MGDRGNGSVYRRRGTKYWWIQYFVRVRQPDGTFKSVARNESSKLTKKTEARALLNERLAEYGSRPQYFGRDLSLSDVRDIAVAKYKARGRKTPEKVEGAFKHLMDLLEVAGPMRAKDVSESDLDLFVAARQRDKVSMSTIKNELSLLHRGFYLASKKGRFNVPIFPEIEVPDNARQVFFDYASFECVRNGLREYQRPLVTFEFYVGWRISEVVGLRQRGDITEPSNVDWDAETIALRPNETKAKDRRIFPWGKIPELREMMLAQREWIHEIEKKRSIIIPWLFPRPNGKKLSRWGLRKSWTTACTDCHVAGARLHDFRRTACRNIVRAGNRLETAMELVGWKRRETAQRYNIEDMRDREEAAERLAGFIDAEKQKAPKIVPLKPAVGSN